MITNRISLYFGGLSGRGEPSLLISGGLDSVVRGKAALQPQLLAEDARYAISLGAVATDRDMDGRKPDC